MIQDFPYVMDSYICLTRAYFLLDTTNSFLYFYSIDKASLFGKQ